MEETAEGDAVEAADELAFPVDLDAMGDAEAVKARAEAVARQTEAKK